MIVNVRELILYPFFITHRLQYSCRIKIKLQHNHIINEDEKTTKLRNSDFVFFLNKRSQLYVGTGLSTHVIYYTTR